MGVLSVYFIKPNDMPETYYNYLKSITFYGIDLVNKSQTMVNGVNTIVLSSDDTNIEKIDRALIETSSGTSIFIDFYIDYWNDNLGLDIVTITKIKTYFASQIFKNIIKIDLPQGLKTIGEILTADTEHPSTPKNMLLLAFPAMTEIVIPDSVETIGDWVFFSNNFTTINIPKNVKSIGHYSFAYSQKVKDVIIPNNVVQMGIYCFQGCKLLESLKIGNGIVRLEQTPRIGDGNYGHFCDCPNLKEIIFGKNITYIDSYTFANCPLIEFIAVPSENVEIKGLQFISANDKKQTNFSNPGGPPYKATILTIDSDKNPDTKLAFLEPKYETEKAYYNYILLNKYPDDITIPKITRDFLQKKAQCYIDAETSCQSTKIKDKCYRDKIRQCLIEYNDEYETELGIEGFQTGYVNGKLVYNNIYVVLGLMVAMLIGVQIMNKYKLVSDLVSNSASMLLLSAGLIYSVILYQHLESADSKKVLILSKNVDVPKTEKPLTEVESKQITPFEPITPFVYHSYTK
jgi:hypothetical protein